MKQNNVAQKEERKQQLLERVVEILLSSKAMSIFVITGLLCICLAMTVQSRSDNAKEFHSGMQLSELVHTLDTSIPAGYEDQIKEIKSKYKTLLDTNDVKETYRLNDEICEDIEDLIAEAKDNIDK